MGLRVRSSYEDVVAWIRSGGGPPVPYPKRTELQLMDSHVYSQLNALMSAQETQHIVNEYRRGGFGRPPPGGPGNQPPGGPPAPSPRPPRPAPIAPRAPRDQHLELAIDADGRLHIVGRATDATAILRARGWAREHGELLSLADPRISSGERGIDPVIDLVVSDLRDARAIDGATVHVLTLGEIAGRRGYLAQIAPE